MHYILSHNNKTKIVIKFNLIYAKVFMILIINKKTYLWMYISVYVETTGESL